MPNNDREQVALVTGAAGGIGAATSRRFAEDGFIVVVADIDRDGAEAVATSITTDGGQAEAWGVDVSDTDSVASLAAHIEGAYGSLDAVHANAATMATYGDVLQTEPEVWDRTFAINTRGAFLTARASLPLLERDGGGAICFSASDTTVRTSYAYAAYLSSKHAVVGLAKSVAVDFGSRGVRSNAISPGVTDTPALRGLYAADGRDSQEGFDRAAALSPLGRVAMPEDIADAVVFLCSRRAAFITGAHLVVDGGMTVTYAAE
jgi:NAD(P)-dependent dehydrogenase (short-subunit alcohol dehydrogenase family)